jgi:hypothetical protein
MMLFLQTQLRFLSRKLYSNLTSPVLGEGMFDANLEKQTLELSFTTIDGIAIANKSVSTKSKLPTCLAVNQRPVKGDGNAARQRRVWLTFRLDVE